MIVDNYDPGGTFTQYAQTDEERAFLNHLEVNTRESDATTVHRNGGDYLWLMIHRDDEWWVCEYAAANQVNLVIISSDNEMMIYEVYCH